MKHLKKLVLLGAMSSAFAAPGDIVFANTTVRSAGDHSILSFLVIKEHKDGTDSIDVNGTEVKSAKHVNSTYLGVGSKTDLSTTFDIDLYDVKLPMPAGQEMGSVPVKIGNNLFTVHVPGANMKVLAYHADTAESLINPWGDLNAKNFGLRIVGGSCGIDESLNSPEESKVVSEVLSKITTGMKTTPAIAKAPTSAKPDLIAKKYFYEKLAEWKDPQRRKMLVEVPAIYGISQTSLTSCLYAYQNDRSNRFRFDGKTIMEAGVALKLLLTFDKHIIPAGEDCIASIVTKENASAILPKGGNLSSFDRFGDLGILTLDMVTDGNGMSLTKELVEQAKTVMLGSGQTKMKTLIVSAPTPISAMFEAMPKTNEGTISFSTSIAAAYPTQIFSVGHSFLVTELTKKDTDPKKVDYSQLQRFCQILSTATEASEKVYLICNEGKENSVHNLVFTKADGTTSKVRLIHCAPVTAKGYRTLPDGISQETGLDVGGVKVDIVGGKTVCETQNGAIEFSSLNSSSPSKPKFLQIHSKDGATTISTKDYRTGHF